MSSRWISVLAALALASAWGCGGDDSGGDNGGSGGGGTGGAAGAATGGTSTGGTSTGGTSTGGTSTGGTSTGGTAGTASGGTAGSATGGTAGSATGGTAGSASGGAAGSASGGAAGAGTGGSSFWPNAYNANGTPNPANGKHNAGKDCLNCHKAGGAASGNQWLFGGTVYKADKTTAAPHVEVGVKDGSNVYTTYSANNGNFWLAAGPTVNWSSVEIRIRNSNGEKKMSSQPNGGSCNSCHTASMVLVEP